MNAETTPTRTYWQQIRRVLGELEEQQVKAAADLVANALYGGGIVHVFGGGHSALLAQEVFFRAGGLVAIRPVLDRRIQFEDGALESTEFERTIGAAEDLAKDAGLKAG